jgi:DinB superfamily
LPTLHCTFVVDSKQKYPFRHRNVMIVVSNKIDNHPPFLMDKILKKTLWHQFGATIDMLENAIKACPPDLWDNAHKYWYTAYHTLFFMDYYLSADPSHFSPPPPFTLSEMDPSGILPDRTYTQEELLTYLGHCRTKCHDLIAGLTPELAAKRWINSYRNYDITEILLYNMRHVQHHTAQLNMLLRQQGAVVPDWVSRTAGHL